MISLSLVARRRFLQVSALGSLALRVPRSSSARAGGTIRPGADSCILVFLYGGPSQLETFDPKPEAPAEIRGEFGVTRTATPGVVLCDRLPRLARCQQSYALIRTCQSTSVPSHSLALHESLTGHLHPEKNLQATTVAKSSDWPAFSTVVGKLAPGGQGLRCVQVPDYSRDGGGGPIYAGQLAGFLGAQHNPFLVRGNPADPRYDVRDLALPPDVTPARLQERRELLQALRSERLEHSVAAQPVGALQEQAFDLLTRNSVREAFALRWEPVAVRERYGMATIGQSCLLARRLVEANVKMITVNAYDQSWDTHGNHVELHNKLLPPFDQAVSALLEDLEQRGLVRRTLVIVMGEFGRTPRLDLKYNPPGRDHWVNCYSALLAGGGVRGGLVLGQSDRIAAYPREGRIVTPADLCATVYQTMGIEPDHEIQDAEGRPMRLTAGRPVNELF